MQWDTDDEKFRFWLNMQKRATKWVIPSSLAGVCSHRIGGGIGEDFTFMFLQNKPEGRFVTDSSILLQYVCKVSGMLDTFVGYMLKVVSKMAEATQSFFVGTACNPAYHCPLGFATTMNYQREQISLTFYHTATQLVHLSEAQSGRRKVRIQAYSSEHRSY